MLCCICLCAGLELYYFLVIYGRVCLRPIYSHESRLIASAIAKKSKLVEERTPAVSVLKQISKAVMFSYVKYISIKTYKQYCVQRD